jgi:hypothetical protein
LTTLLNNEEKFWIYRRFKLSHSRVLLELESEISLIEQKLGSLDESHATLEPRQCRLQTAEFEGWDTTQQDLLQQLREKLLIYGRLCRVPLENIMLVLTHPDELLLNHGKLWELGQASGKDHLNVFNEITKKNPIGQNQYDRNNFPDDFISLMPQSLIGQLEHFINKLLKVCFALLDSRFSVLADGHTEAISNSQTSTHDACGSVDSPHLLHKARSFCKTIYHAIRHGLFYAPSLRHNMASSDVGLDLVLYLCYCTHSFSTHVIMYQ